MDKFGIMINNIFGDWAGLVLLLIVILPLCIVKGCEYNLITTQQQLKLDQKFTIECLEQCNGSVIYETNHILHCDCRGDIVYQSYQSSESGL